MFQVLPPMLMVLKRSQFNNSRLTKGEENILISLLLSYRNVTHRDFYRRKLHADMNSHRFHIHSMNKIIKLANTVLKNANLASMGTIPPRSANGSRFLTLRDVCQSGNIFSAEGLWMYKTELFLSQEETSTPLDIEILKIAESTHTDSLSIYQTEADTTGQAPHKAASPNI